MAVCAAVRISVCATERAAVQITVDSLRLTCERAQKGSWLAVLSAESIHLALSAGG